MQKEARSSMANSLFGKSIGNIGCAYVLHVGSFTLVMPQRQHRLCL